MQYCLTLLAATGEIAWLTIAPDLFYVTSYRFPPPNLAIVFFRNAATHVVAAVPLEPPPWVIGIDPTISFPN
jgi:hypothetical protein